MLTEALNRGARHLPRGDRSGDGWRVVGRTGVAGCNFAGSDNYVDHGQIQEFCLGYCGNQGRSGNARTTMHKPGTVAGCGSMLRVTAIGTSPVPMVHVTRIHGGVVHGLTWVHLAGKGLQRQAGYSQGQQEGQAFFRRVTHSLTRESPKYCRNINLPKQ